MGNNGFIITHYGPDQLGDEGGGEERVPAVAPELGEGGGLARPGGACHGGRGGGQGGG